MKKYRTEEQFHEIMDSAMNGNWSAAFKEAEEYGFYAQDLIKYYEEFGSDYGYEFEDLVYIAEGAQKLRN
jgi:hypothetical protein